MLLNAFIQWLHITAAVVGIGGIAFLRLILIPSLANLEPPARERLLQSVLPKFRLAVWTVIGVLIGSGLYNLATSAHLGDPRYLRALEIKILVAVILFAISFGITLPFPALAGMQKQRPRWLAVNVVLGIIILLFSAYLRRI